MHVLCYNVIKTGLQARYEQRKGDFDELHNLRLPRAVLPLCLSWMASGNDSGGCSEKTHGKQRLSEWPAVCHLRNHGCFHDPLPVRTAVQPGLSVSRLYDHRHRRRMDRRPRPGTATANGGIIPTKNGTWMATSASSIPFSGESLVSLP